MQESQTLIATKVVCFSCLLKCLRSLYGKQCGPRSDCSYRSSLIWVYTVCLYTVELQWLKLGWLIHLGWLELSLWSLQVILSIIHPWWLELPLARTILYGPKPVRAIEVLPYLTLLNNVGKNFAADNFSRQHFQMHFFLRALRVNLQHTPVLQVSHDNVFQWPFQVYGVQGICHTCLTPV